MKRCKISLTNLLMFQVTIVVNFDLPVDVTGTADCETYLHRLVECVDRLWSDGWVYRIGRTGRFGKHGLAINLVDGPKSMAVLKEIERHFGKDIVKLDAEVNSF
jgi:ATP-dependent RNA helicase DDX19/DBP5